MKYELEIQWKKNGKLLADDIVVLSSIFVWDRTWKYMSKLIGKNKL